MYLGTSLADALTKEVHVTLSSLSQAAGKRRAGLRHWPGPRQVHRACAYSDGAPAARRGDQDHRDGDIGPRAAGGLAETRMRGGRRLRRSVAVLATRDPRLGA